MGYNIFLGRHSIFY